MMEWMITSSALILLMMGLRWVLKGRIRQRIQYALWSVVLVRLLVPWNLADSPISILQLTRQPEVRTAMVFVQEPIRWESQELVTDDVSGETTIAHNSHFLADQENLNHFYSPAELAVEIWKWGCILLICFMLTSNWIFLRKLKGKRRKMEVPGMKIPVYISPMAQTPCLAGLLFPAIYLPEQAMEPVQLRHVLAHERTHYRHGDHVIGVLRCVALALHWYNPLVWWAAKASKQDSELACDEGTIAWLGEHERISYGKTLLEMTCQAKHEKVMLTATAMYAGKHSLKERVLRIAKKPKMALATLICLGLAVILAVGCTFTGVEKGNPMEDLSNEELIYKLEQMEDPQEIEETLIALAHISRQYGVGIYERTNYGRHGRGHELNEERIETLGSLLAQYEWSRTSENALLRDSDQWMELVFGYGVDVDWKIRLECSALQPELVFLSAYGLDEEGRINCAAENLLFRAELQTDDPRTAESSSIYQMMVSLFEEHMAQQPSMEETVVSPEAEDGKWLPELLAGEPDAMLIQSSAQSPTFAFQIRQEEIGILTAALDGCTIVNDPNWNPPEEMNHPIMMSVPGVCQMLIYETAPYLYVNAFAESETTERFAMLKVEPKDPDAPGIYEVVSQLYRDALEGEYYQRTSQRIAETLREALLGMGEEGMAEEVNRWRWLEGLIRWDVGQQEIPVLSLEGNGFAIAFYSDQNLLKFTSDGENHYYFALPAEGADWNASLCEAVYSCYLQQTQTAQWRMGADDPSDMTVEEVQECKTYLQWFDWTPIEHWDLSMEPAGESIVILQGEEELEFFDGTDQVRYTSALGSAYYSLTPKSDEIRPIWDIMLTMYDNRTQ